VRVLVHSGRLVGCAPVMVHSGHLVAHQSWFILGAWLRTSHGSFWALGCAPVMVHFGRLVAHQSWFILAAWLRASHGSFWPLGRAYWLLFGQSKNTKDFVRA